MKRILTFLCVWVCSLVYATSYDALSFEQMLARAELAFYGVVIGSTVIEQDGEPWTQVSFEVLESFRGLDEDAVSLELLFFGGQTEAATVQVSLMPVFQEAEKVLVFAYEAQYYSPIVGFRQGLWRESENGFRSETGEFLSLEEGTIVLSGNGLSPLDLLSNLRQAFEVEP